VRYLPVTNFEQTGKNFVRCFSHIVWLSISLSISPHSDEEGLQAEKDKVSSKVLETRRRTIEDVVTRVLLDGEVCLYHPR